MSRPSNHCHTDPRDHWLTLLLVGIATVWPQTSDAQQGKDAPTVLQVPVGGGRPVIVGQKSPSPDKRLGAKVDKQKKEEQARVGAASEAGAKKAADAQRKAGAEAARRQALARKAAGQAQAQRDAAAAAKLRYVPTLGTLIVGVGYVSVPRQLSDKLTNHRHYPQFVGVGLDVSALWPARTGHHYGVRLGLSVPDVAASNWYSDGEQPPPVYIDPSVAMIDLAFEYAYRRPLFGPIGWSARAGLGLSFLVGQVTRIETLPGCPEDKKATCPHWREVGRLPDGLPSRLWPALQAVAALTAELSGGVGVQLEAGVRGGLYAGLAVSAQR
jgi:hypothetical protein